jgi:2',3'-cyclic-nucleotide 2'-phosphodiesterase
MRPVRILFVGDVVGSPGRRLLEELLPELRRRHSIDFVVVNGENAAGGLGITEKIARGWLERHGVDAITLGNHAYRHSDVYEFLDSDPRIVRPANYPQGNPGRGHTVVERDGQRLAVVNLSGSVFLDVARSPFATIDALLEHHVREVHVLVDFHAEATSEKVALGWYVDGRATACVGTHTHVPTADARVLPGGTAYITDVGMTGPRGGVIGVERDLAIRRFVTQMPVKFETSREDPWLNAVVIEARDDGRAASIEQILVNSV